MLIFLWQNQGSGPPPPPTPTGGAGYEGTSRKRKRYTWDRIVDADGETLELKRAADDVIVIDLPQPAPSTPLVLFPDRPIALPPPAPTPLELIVDGDTTTVVWPHLGAIPLEDLSYRDHLAEREDELALLALLGLL